MNALTRALMLLGAACACGWVAYATSGGTDAEAASTALSRLTRWSTLYLPVRNTRSHAGFVLLADSQRRAGLVISGPDRIYWNSRTDTLISSGPRGDVDYGPWAARLDEVFDEFQDGFRGSTWRRVKSAHVGLEVWDVVLPFPWRRTSS